MAKPITIGLAGGEYMESVVVLEWTAKVGDNIKQGDAIITVETAKAATEIEAPCDGVLTAQFVEIGAEIPVTEILGLVGVDAHDTDYDRSTTETEPEEIPAETQPIAVNTPMVSAVAQGRRIIASPAARRAATRTGIDLTMITPSSPFGRIKLRDIIAGVARSNPFVTAALPPDQPGSLKIYHSGPKDGTPIVMLHGFGSDANSWHTLEKTLSRSARVIRIDLPNHGRSPKRRMGQFRTLAREVVEAFDALDLEDAHLIGHSLGGECALALADVRPRKIKTLTLLAPGGLGPRINGDLIDGLARASRPESLEQWLKVMVVDPRLISTEFVQAVMASRADPELRMAQQQMAQDLFPDGAQGFDMRGALDRLTCPTRIIWGKQDAVIPWKHVLGVPGRVGLHLFNGVGHVPHMEIPDMVLEIMLSQLSASMGR